MRIVLDEERCQGHGRCYGLAPEVFEPDDYGHCRVRHEVVEGELLDAARKGVENCPERALSLTE
jgi:ferredoxin